MRQKGIWKLRIGVPLALLLLGFASASCSANRCAQGRDPRYDSFPFLDLESLAHTSEVTIYGDEKARSGINKSYVEAAAKKWNDACQKPCVPHFVVDWEHERPEFEDRVWRTTIWITYSPDEEVPPYDPQKGKKTDVAKWLPGDNSIHLFGKCGHRKVDMPCQQIRDSIVWQSPWGSMVMAHEIGHALGLWHDFLKCKRGVMREDINEQDIKFLSILSEYCRLADDINNKESPCNRIEPNPNSSVHPCDDPASGNKKR